MNETTSHGHNGSPCPGFFPKPPESLAKLKIPQALLADLVLRRLYLDRRSSLSALSQSLKISVPVLQNILQWMREQQVVQVTGMQGNDYFFTLTETGHELSARARELCQYAGPAPVSLKEYNVAVRAQASRIRLNRSCLRDSFGDLELSDALLDQLGPALVSQTSLFLYGPTGNGKTSIASRLSRIYDDAILIPYAVEVDGQIIVVYDPVVHERIEGVYEDLDPRWVVCRRPSLSVGGELEPSMLELQLDENGKVYAAPVQMKANNGILVIDDFGRQIVSPQYLLNRWIVPLDLRVDYLSLRYGVKFQIPFELMVVFATNFDPNELADEAFLRRIQNKVYVEPVAAEIFDAIFRRRVMERRLECTPDQVQLLRSLCLEAGHNGLRACYPEDILNIVTTISIYEEKPVEINKMILERATALYFTRTRKVP